MSDLDFEFGANTPGSIADDLPKCYGPLVCMICGKKPGVACDEIQEMKTRPLKEKHGMNVGAYTKNGQGERNPFIQAKDVKGGSAKVKILSAREVTTPKYHGLMCDIKHGDKKFCLSLRFDRPIDLSNVAKQMGSDDTDDWLGQQLALVTVKSKDGKKTFLNVAQSKTGKIVKKGRKK